MYIQLTDKCNFTCEHCCFNSGPSGQAFMSMNTFRAALEQSGGYVCLGGGEPTLHPQFERMLLEAVANMDTEEGGVCVITNGTHKRRSLMLAGLAAKKIVDAELSRDAYHDTTKVDDQVVRAFTRLNRIRNTTKEREPLAAGRAVTEVFGYGEFSDYEPDCPCDDIFVRPNGDIHQCGCHDSPKIGHVTMGYESPEHGTCYRHPSIINHFIDKGLLV